MSAMPLLKVRVLCVHFSCGLYGIEAGWAQGFHYIWSLMKVFMAKCSFGLWTRLTSASTSTARRPEPRDSALDCWTYSGSKGLRSTGMCLKSCDHHVNSI